MTAPYGVASDAVLWVKADSFITPGGGMSVGPMTLTSSTTAPADGTNVATWDDQSGAGNDMSEVFATRQPKFYSNIFGSLPAVKFDGTDDKLETAAPVTTVTNNWTMVLVADPLSPDTNTASHSGLVPFTNGEGGSGYGIAFNIDPAGISTGAEKKGIHFGGVSRFYSAQAPDTSPHIWVMRRSSGTTNLYVDGGSSILSTGTAPSTPTTFTRLGSQQDSFAAAQFHGYIAEAIIWDVALSDSDLNTVGNALERWGPTWTNV